MLGRIQAAAALRAVLAEARSLDPTCARGCVGRAPLVGPRTREFAMLRIYDLVIQLVRSLRPFIDSVAQHDSDLARQARRALASVPLNIAEGSGSRGGNRCARYHSAAGSMQEVVACVDVALALGYVESLDPLLRDQMLKVVATLKKVAL